MNKNGNEADLTMRVSENCAFIQITRIRYFQLQNRCRNSHGRSNIGSTSMRILIECIDRVYIISRKKKPYIYMWISDRVGVISPFFLGGRETLSLSPNRLVFGVLTAHVLGSRLSNERGYQTTDRVYVIVRSNRRRISRISADFWSRWIIGRFIVFPRNRSISVRKI